MIEIWLTFNNREEAIQLPVTPMYTLEAEYHNNVINLHTVGDVNLPGNRGLKGLNLESFFPEKGRKYYFARTEEPLPPMEAVAMIEKWAESRRPIRVIVTERNINLPMLIESFSYGDADKSGDVYFSLHLKEYVFLKAPKLSTADGTTTKTAKSGEHKELKTWNVRYGDTLTGIALSAYGDSSEYKKIIELNKDLIKNPNSLKAIVGEVIKLV